MHWCLSAQVWRIWASSSSFHRGFWRFVLRMDWRWDMHGLAVSACLLWSFWRDWVWLCCCQIFTEDLTEVETLPRDKVLNFLKEGFKELAIPYLEHIIYMWEETRPEFHNVLIQLYLEKVQGLMKAYLNSLPEGQTLLYQHNYRAAGKQSIFYAAASEKTKHRSRSTAAD